MPGDTIPYVVDRMYGFSVTRYWYVVITNVTLLSFIVPFYFQFLL